LAPDVSIVAQATIEAASGRQKKGISLDVWNSKLTLTQFKEVPFDVAVYGENDNSGSRD
jgi:hypothetical protein